MDRAIGRANRFHHWMDILDFQDEGMFQFDFGGWYPGSKDEARLSINRFKESFGGEVRTTYNGERALSSKGRAYLAVRSIHRTGLPQRLGALYRSVTKGSG
jgi:hypothetical protein